MQYKILFVKNRFKGKLKLNKYLDWFAKYTPIQIVCEEITTDFDITTQPVSNDTFKGVICGNDILPKLRTVIPEHKYHCVVLICGNDLKGIRVSCTNGLGRKDNLYPNTELIQLVKLNDSGKTLNHELFHAFFAKLNRVGINVVDNMDTYYRDNVFDINKSETNRTIALKALNPYWDNIIIEQQQRIATLTRKPSTEFETLGLMEARNGNTILYCQSLELPWKNNQGYISCIPTGTYKVKWTFSPKFLRYTYEVQGVPNRSGIRIHYGNYAYKKDTKDHLGNTQGCILLGDSVADINKDGIPDITNTRATIASFEGLFNKQDFTLIIR